MGKNGNASVEKNEREIEEAKRKQRKKLFYKAGVAAWFVVSFGCLFGGMFSEINGLVLAGLILLFGGALAASFAVLAVGYINHAKKDLAKYGGSVKPYIYKGVLLAVTISVAIVFGVLGFVLSEYYLIGAVVSFFLFIIIIFGWQI